MNNEKEIAQECAVNYMDIGELQNKRASHTFYGNLGIGGSFHPELPTGLTEEQFARFNGIASQIFEILVAEKLTAKDGRDVLKIVTNKIRGHEFWCKMKICKIDDPLVSKFQQ